MLEVSRATAEDNLGLRLARGAYFFLADVPIERFFCFVEENANAMKRNVQLTVKKRTQWNDACACMNVPPQEKILS